MGLVVGKHELRDLGLYVSVAAALLALTLYMAVYHPDINLSSNWVGFGAITSVVFGVLLRGYWTYRKTTRLWACLLVLLALHIVCLAGLQRWHPEYLSFGAKCILSILESVVLSVPMTLIVGPAAASRSESR